MKRFSMFSIVLLVLVGGNERAVAAKLKVPQQFATIQAAVDAAAINDVIVVAPGVYPENVNVSKMGLTLRGNGAIVDGGGSPCLSVVSTSGVEVDGFTLRNAGATAALQVGFSIDVVIRNCVVRDSGDDGILVGICQGVVVEENKVMDVLGTGIAVVSDHVLVRGNLVKRAGVGISVVGTFNTVENNRIRATEDTGIDVGDDISDVTNCLVADNSTKDTNDGILVRTASQLAIVDNVISAAQDEGIDLLRVTGGLIAKNKVKTADEDGIEFGQCADCVTERNTVLSSGADGFDVESSPELLFRANTAKKSGSSGFFTATTDGVYVENKASGSGTFDLDDSGMDNVFIANVFGTIKPIV